MAFDAGADMITVIGGAALPTVEQALAVARERGKEMLMELTGVRDILARAAEWRRIVPDAYIWMDFFSVRTSARPPLPPAASARRNLPRRAPPSRLAPHDARPTVRAEVWRGRVARALRRLPRRLHRHRAASLHCRRAAAAPEGAVRSRWATAVSSACRSFRSRFDSSSSIFASICTSSPSACMSSASAPP